MTYGKMTLGKMTLSITSFSKTAFVIMTRTVNDPSHYIT